MMNLEEIISNILFMACLLTTYTFNKNHIMNNLIIIEFMIITILTFMFKIMTMTSMENYLIMYFMITAICESITGLSLMIAMIRTHGNDYLKSTNIMQY